MFKIGYMEYANVYPIFYYLLKNKNLSFFKSYPAELNKAMREGRIDLSPSSSIEYAKNSSLYKVISGISVSSVGAVKSVNVFSDIPLEKMGGKKIYFTKESNTSTVLTRIIFEEFYKIPVEYTNSLEEAHAELLIGDKALYSYYNTDYKYIFDLGQEWYKFTGLPFVFALWIVGKNAWQKDEFRLLADELRHYASISCKNYSHLTENYIELGYTAEQMSDYWNTIDYNLTDKHIEGLKLFYDYAHRLGEAPFVSEIGFC